FASRRRHTRFSRDWSSDVCSSDLSRLLEAGGHRAGHVAVSDQLDPGAGSPHLLDELLVPGSVEDTDGEVLHVALQRLRDAAQVLRGSLVDRNSTRLNSIPVYNSLA